MNEMLDSQLSAMFDNELPAAECELLARRLSRDDALRNRWRHYALIGAAVRGERNVRLEIDLAQRLNPLIAAEPALSAPQAGASVGRSVLARRVGQGLAGAAMAAGVAALSIFWLRAQTPGETHQVAQTAVPVAATADADGAESYVVPASNADTRAVVLPTELANYVVAHSEFSTPLSRRNLLSALVASEAGAPSESTPPEPAVPPDAVPNP